MKQQHAYRKIHFLLLPLLAVFAMACSGEEEESSSGGTERAGQTEGNQQIDNALFGEWGYLELDTEFTSFRTSFRFEPGTVTATNQCSFGGDTIEVSASVPANYTATEIESLSFAESGDENCNVSIEAGTLTYRVNGNQLTMSDGEFSLELSRL